MAFCLNIDCNETAGGWGGDNSSPFGSFGFVPTSAREVLGQRQMDLAAASADAGFSGNSGSVTPPSLGTAPTPAISALDLSGVPVAVAEWAQKLGIPTWLLWAFISLIAFSLLRSWKVL